MPNMWAIRNDALDQELLDEGFISLGWDEIPDLHGVGRDREQIKKLLSDAYPDAKVGAVPIWAGILFRFAFDFAVGDFVVAPYRGDGTLNFGRVIGDYYYDAEVHVHRHRRRVEWLRTGASRSEFPPAVRNELGSIMTLFKIEKNVDQLRRFIESGAVDQPEDASPTHSIDERPKAWLVGASIDSQDMTEEFLAAGIWHLSPKASQRRRRTARGMRPGDLIAIKSTSTKRHDLPFENHGALVSTLRVKARGKIASVGADGVVQVDWDPTYQAREWYFYTYLGVVWRLPEGHVLAEALRAFVFDDAEQDYELFLQHDFWAERYSEQAGRQRDELEEAEYSWIPFFEVVASELADHETKRTELAHAFVEIRQQAGLSAYLDTNADGTQSPVHDMDPFTFMNLFNLGRMTDSRRTDLAMACAEYLGLDVSPPSAFTGIPVTFPLNAWMFPFAHSRTDEIDRLWRVFTAGLRWADAPEQAGLRDSFEEALTEAFQASDWQIATALFRARPRFFFPMDGKSRWIVGEIFDVRVPDYSSPKASRFYIQLLERITSYTQDPSTPYGSPAEVSNAAWEQWGRTTSGASRALVAGSAISTPQGVEIAGMTADRGLPEGNDPDFPEPYTVDDLMADGCFVPREVIDRILSALRQRKNVILQGAPGTGKTWLAQRLAWVLAGEKRPESVRVVQFHPNTSYEDFVRGYRPRATDDGGTAGLVLTDGPFLRLVNKAHDGIGRAHVMVIEEINRGNPARAFGEMLTLLEDSKRTEQDAINLTYGRPDETFGVWLPENFHVVGTMNIADRSLALVDLALRRRFAFFTLVPQFNESWASWAESRIVDDVDVPAFVQAVRQGMESLNEVIRRERSLGPNFVIGHSYLTPTVPVSDVRTWLEERVETGIRPLLEEYWFDASDKADEHASSLLSVWS